MKRVGGFQDIIAFLDVREGVSKDLLMHDYKKSPMFLE